MKKQNLILIHPPSIFDFRKKPIFFGPISDAVPSTPIFDMFPIGFITMAEYLHRYGFNIDVVNLAAKMLEDNKFDVKKFLESLKSDVFGIDLHWMPHVQGCLEVAKILKELHPNSRIILGGLTSTFYHQEIMSSFKYIDAIIKGDSGELPIRRYLEACAKNQFDMSNVPNLSWRNENGKVCHNQVTYVQDNLDELAVDYKYISSFMIKTLLNSNRTPYFEWKRFPIAATLSCKGCSYNCVTCGGSKYTYSKYFNRDNIGLRSPEKIARDLVGITRYRKIPVWLIGDVRLGGTKYVDTLFRRIKEEKIDSPVIIELFAPANEEFINKLSQSIPRFGLSFSPDSGNEMVRRAQGKDFTNSAIEKTISSALDVSTSRFDLFFMLGLGRDTPKSVSETFRYAESLMEKFGKKKLYIYMTTLTPTLDPGSIAFDKPSDHGFHLHYRTLLQHYQGFSNPSWKYFLNYSTDTFDVDGLVNLTYQVASFMADFKAKFDLIKLRELESVKDRIILSKNLLYKIDTIMKLDDKKERNESLEQLTDIIQNNQGDRVIHALNELVTRL